MSAEADDARSYLSSLDKILHAEANLDMTTEKRIASGELRRRAGTALLLSPRPITGDPLLTGPLRPELHGGHICIMMLVAIQAILRMFPLGAFPRIAVALSLKQGDSLLS